MRAHCITSRACNRTQDMDVLASGSYSSWVPSRGKDVYGYQDLETLSKNLSLNYLRVELDLAKHKTRLKLNSTYPTADELPLDELSSDQVQFLLVLAAYHGDHASVEALMTKNPSSKCICQVNALQMAIIKGHAKCVAAILAPGVSREGWLKTKLHQQYSPLHLAVYFEHVPCLIAILSSARDRMDVIDFMHKTSPQCTPLHIATMLDSVEAAELLLANGADLEGKPVIYTPLHVAAKYENQHMTYWLLNQGADWKSRTPKGFTALALVENHVPEAMTDYLDSCIMLNNHCIQSEDVIVHVDSSKLTTRPLQITGSLLSEFKKMGNTWRLEHPTCQIMLSNVTSEVTLLHLLYLVYCFIGLCLALYFIMSTYGCICNLSTDSSFGPNKTCQYSLEAYDICGNATGYRVSIAWTSHYLLIPFILSTLAVRIYTIFIVIDASQETFTYAKFHNQFYNVENWVEAVANLLVIYLYFASNSLNRGYTAENITLQTLASLVVLMLGLNMIFKLGKMPWLGVYVSMCFLVLKEYYIISTLFIATLTMYMLAVDISFMGYFQKGGFSLAKLYGVMIGELDLKDLINNAKFPTQSSHFLAELLVYCMIIVVSIVLANLLIGIVVSDIAELKLKAFQNSICKRIEIVEKIELIFPNLFRRFYACWNSLPFEYNENYIIKAILNEDALYMGCYGADQTYSLRVLKEAVKIGMKRKPTEMTKISADPFSKLRVYLSELNIKSKKDKNVHRRLMRILHEALAECLKINDDL